MRNKHRFDFCNLIHPAGQLIHISSNNTIIPIGANVTIQRYNIEECEWSLIEECEYQLRKLSCT